MPQFTAANKVLASQHCDETIDRLGSSTWKAVCLKWLIAYGLLLFAGSDVWVSHWLIAPIPSSVEDALLQVRVGMSRDEAIAALQSYDQDVIESVWCSGHTKDGLEFFKSWFYKSEFQ